MGFYETEQKKFRGEVTGDGAPVVKLNLSPSAELETNEAGGKQSKIPARCDLLPPLATLAVAQVLHGGAEKYGVNNWHSIPVESHLNHALVHVFAYLAGDRQDLHLDHAACRLLMALELQKKGVTGNGG